MGVPLEHMRWAGQYAAIKKPDRIIHIGDHWDMPSLSSYDKGKKSFENRRYKKDIAAGNLGMDLFMQPIYDEMERDPWELSLDFFMGNHEQRVDRVSEVQPELDGVLDLVRDSNLEKHGWKIHPFLEVVNVDGIAYSHYFTSGVMGRPVTSARALLTKKHCSCIMGHVQQYEVAIAYDANGKRLTALFAGCYYQHDEEYLTPQGNASTWRGIHMLYGVDGTGQFTHNSVELSYLRERFADV
jgi:hypothetical protein